MEDATGKPKKQPKRPKIVQILTTDEGKLAAAVYDNGKVFIWKHENAPNPFGTSAYEHGYWTDGIALLGERNNQKNP